MLKSDRFRMLHLRRILKSASLLTPAIVLAIPVGNALAAGGITVIPDWTVIIQIVNFLFGDRPASRPQEKYGAGVHIPITCPYDSLYPQPGRRVGILDNRSAVGKAAQAHVLDRPMIWLSIFPREREKASANRQGVGRLNMWKSQYKTFFRRGSP